MTDTSYFSRAWVCSEKSCMAETSNFSRVRVYGIVKSYEWLKLQILAMDRPIKISTGNPASTYTPNNIDSQRTINMNVRLTNSGGIDVNVALQ